MATPAPSSTPTNTDSIESIQDVTAPPSSSKVSRRSQHDDSDGRPSGVTTSTLKQFGRWVVDADEEELPTVSSFDYFRELGSHPAEKTIGYFRSLFPFLSWLPHYNFTWLVGDLIAGITVGLVLVPQSMSYAGLANLRPEFGLYSSFVGVFVYAFFATSKDVSIGPVAVMSLETGRIISSIQASHPGQWASETIATAVAFICGFIVLGIGLLRLGWIIEFIPVPAVAGFMTGSAINIAAGQVPALFGISKLFNTKDSTYLVIINTLKNLKHSKLDAALGVPSLFGLYLVKWTCAFGEKRWPKWRKMFFFVSVTRNAFTIIIYTVIAWQLTIHAKKAPVSILGTVPSGFQHVGPPKDINSNMLNALASHLPVATIILLLEHIAIAKSFGRVNNYKINPNQELIAIGVANTLGSLFNAYPSTGSFSRSALKSKSGVRTPAAGIPTGLCVIIALYALTSTFYFIPNAVLSAVIIHAVADLVVSPRQAYRFWLVSPLEAVIWFAAVIITVFTTIEDGIYFSLAASIVLLLFRIARPAGNGFLGRVKVKIDESETEKGGIRYREIFVPFKTPRGGMTNPQVRVEPPPAGIVIYRLDNSFTYPNASYHNSALVDHVKATTRRGKLSLFTKPGDRPWNDPGPSRWTAAGRAALAAEQEAMEHPSSVSKLPLIRAVVLDFQAVASLDTTGVQNLVDTRKEIERWADAPVNFHFSGIISPWVQRALIAGGFGIDKDDLNSPCEVTPVVPVMDSTSVRKPLDELALERMNTRQRQHAMRDRTAEEGSLSSVEEPLISRRTPFFHFDLEEAVRAATSGANSRSESPS